MGPKELNKRARVDTCTEITYVHMYTDRCTYTASTTHIRSEKASVSFPLLPVLTGSQGGREGSPQLNNNNAGSERRKKDKRKKRKKERQLEPGVTGMGASCGVM